LRPGGRLLLELGDGQSDAIRDLFAKTQMWIVEAVKADYNRHPRILIAQRQ